MERKAINIAVLRALESSLNGFNAIVYAVNTSELKALQNEYERVLESISADYLRGIAEKAGANHHGNVRFEVYRSRAEELAERGRCKQVVIMLPSVLHAHYGAVIYDYVYFLNEPKPSMEKSAFVMENQEHFHMNLK